MSWKKSEDHAECANSSGELVQVELHRELYEEDRIHNFIRLTSFRDNYDTIVYYCPRRTEACEKHMKKRTHWAQAFGGWKHVKIVYDDERQ